MELVVIVFYLVEVAEPDVHGVGPAEPFDLEGLPEGGGEGLSGGYNGVVGLVS